MSELGLQALASQRRLNERLLDEPARRESVEMYPRLRFEGRAGEYFRIWIVNLALSILTLGIYSAWAKVRRKRYFYGNTYLRDASFDYHADPRKILRGRALIVLILAIVIICTHVWPMSEYVFWVLLALALPWIVVRAKTFASRNTSYRNVRFDFAQDYRGAAKAFLVPPLIGILVIGLGIGVEVVGGGLAALPFFLAVGLFLPGYWAFSRNRFAVNSTSYGNTGFRFLGEGGDFVWIYFRAGIIAAGLGFLVALATIIVAGATGVKFDQMAQQAESGLVGVLFQVPLLVVMLFFFTYIRTSILNTVLNSTRLGEQKPFGLLSVGAVFLIYLTNLIAVVASLGMLIPWASVRMVRYRTANIGVEINGELDDFVAIAEKESTATGEEAAEFFDIDIGV